jgi:hypothetical protein
MTSTYTVVAIGESTSFTPVELTDVEVAVLLTVLDRVNAAENEGRGQYRSPQLFLFPGELHWDSNHEELSDGRITITPWYDGHRPLNDAGWVD